MRKVVPAHLEQVASITLGALQGQNIQSIIEMNRNIELVNLGGQFIRGIQKPEEMLKGIKNWWEKIKVSTGREKFARVMTQVVVPTISFVVSAGVAVGATPVGAAVLVGTGPIGWAVAAGIILTIATFTVSFMLLSNRAIDLAAFSRDTLRAIKQKEKEKTEELVKDNLKGNPELKSKLQPVAKGYLNDFRQIGLIPAVQRQPIPSNYSENLANFVTTSEGPYHTDCVMILQNYWDGAKEKPKTPKDLANTFHELLTSDQMKAKAEIYIQQHSNSLAHLFEMAKGEEKQQIDGLIKEMEAKREELLNLLVTNEKQRLVDEWFDEHLSELVENQFYDLYPNYQTRLDAVGYAATNKKEDLTKVCKTEIEKTLEEMENLHLRPEDIKTFASTVTSLPAA
jgi:hypothetical protein